MNIFEITTVYFVFFLAAVEFTTSSTGIESYKSSRALKIGGTVHESNLQLGTPDSTDQLLININFVKEKKAGRVVYDDIIFNEDAYKDNPSLVHDCPFTVTAISVVNNVGDDKAAYPLVLYGGVGSMEALILFISQIGEGINATLKIWGREFESENKEFNLLEGVPSVDDHLLMFTNVFQSGQMNEPVTGTVVYKKPENREVTITSIQAWDVSTGCKTGGYPSITEGGVGEDNTVVTISSEKFSGFQYHVLVFGKVNKTSSAP